MTLKDKIIEHIEESIKLGHCYKNTAMCKLLKYGNCRYCVLNFKVKVIENWNLCSTIWERLDENKIQIAIGQLKEVPSKYFTKSKFSRAKFQPIYDELIKTETKENAKND
uniref:Uncharacterized protein n=1 Tax=viral metagenome TaxID=1070528 RepID=A0A6H1ZT70_9ZZZZ